MGKIKELSIEDKWRQLANEDSNTPESFAELLHVFNEINSGRTYDEEICLLQTKKCKEILLNFCKTSAGKKAVKNKLKEYKQDSKDGREVSYYKYAHHCNSLVFYTIALHHADYDLSKVYDVTFNRMRDKNGALGLGNPAFMNAEYQKSAVEIAEIDGKTVTSSKTQKKAAAKSQSTTPKKNKYADELEAIDNELEALDRKARKSSKKEKALNM